MKFVEPIKSKQEIEKMKCYLKNQSSRDALLFIMGINTALRVSDILKLKVSDVVDGEEIKEELEFEDEKLKKKKFPIGKNVKKALKDYLRDYKGHGDRPLFPSRKGEKPLSRQQVWYILNKAAKEVGINARIGSHSLRKTFAYHAYINGMDLSLLQSMLNHSSPKETLSYIGENKKNRSNILIDLNL